MFFDGSATAGLTIDLTGKVASGDVYVVAQSDSNATILGQADLKNAADWFDGDDAVVLRKGTTVIDAIGQIGVDPGTEWGSGTTGAADSTLRRKISIFAGDADGNDVFDPAAEWDGFAVDTFEGLGAHTFSPRANTPGYRCTPTSFRYVQNVRDAAFKDRWDTRIGFNRDGKLTWSVDARWNHPSEGFVGKGSTTVTLDGLGLYSVPLSNVSGVTLIDNDALQAAIGVEQVGEDFPNIDFEPLNYGVFPKASGLITPITADTYQGCPEVPPTNKTLNVHVCSNMELPIFGPWVAQPSVPRYPDRTFCASFNFATVTVNGIGTPTVSDAIFSPVDFVDLSRNAPPSQCRYSSDTCSASVSCQPNVCEPNPKKPGTSICSLGENTTRPWLLRPTTECRTDEDCALNRCEGQQQRPTTGMAYGIRLKIVSSGAVEIGDEQRLAELMRPMWDRRADATARGLVFSKVVDERFLDDGKVERTIVYLFQLTAGSPLTFITRWD